ncbi:MAG: sigma-70 family RNA polymerase sigma factor [Phycisphaerales bacterium]
MLPSDDRAIDDGWARRTSAGVASGSRAALAALYEARFERLFRFVRSRSRRDDAFALDCVHDAWVRVTQSLPALTSLAALDGWLMRAALSATLDRLKSEHSRLAREAQHVVEPPSTVETIESLARELDRLAADDRSLLQLRFWRGLSVRHIAAALGIGEKAVEMRLRRAIGRLGERMEAPDDRA